MPVMRLRPLLPVRQGVSHPRLPSVVMALAFSAALLACEGAASTVPTMPMVDGYVFPTTEKLGVQDHAAVWFQTMDSHLEL